jgi:hypothetical protein
MYSRGAGGAGGGVIELVPGRIPFVAIDAFARRMRINGEEFDRLIRLMSELDSEFIAVWEERANANRTK